jgi:hypothetical protein
VTAAALVDVAFIRNRLDRLGNRRLPSSVTDALLQDYVDGASAQILLAAGQKSPPSPGTVTRSALEDLCADLAVNRIDVAFHRDNPDMLRVLLQEQETILAAARAAAGQQPEGGAFIEIAGAGG